MAFICNDKKITTILAINSLLLILQMYFHFLKIKYNMSDYSDIQSAYKITVNLAGPLHVVYAQRCFEKIKKKLIRGPRYKMTRSLILIEWAFFNYFKSMSSHWKLRNPSPLFKKCSVRTGRRLWLKVQAARRRYNGPK